MTMPLLISLHLLAAVIWIGGMFFAYTALRPVAGALLEQPLRVTLWRSVFERFFRWVIACIAILISSGLWMIFELGGMANSGIHIHIMLLLGIFMMLIFLHLYFNPYRKLVRAVSEKDWIAGGFMLDKIRQLIAINLMLGLVIVVIASGGRYF